MARIKAFHGIRYNLNRVDLAAVTTPPYDIIDSAKQEEYYERSPYNAIRLDLGKTYQDDTDSNNRYTRASADFNNWLRENILTADPEAALYIYRQTYNAPNGPRKTTGMFCRVKIEEFGTGILPHEKTLSAPRKDRRRLLEACRANFSPVFALYADKSAAIDNICASATKTTPAGSMTDEENVTHEIWTLTDSKQIEAITETLAPLRLLIADGHHRYETALNYSKARQSQGLDNDGSDHIMMYLVDMANKENLTILPTHRLLSLTELNIDGLLVRLEKVFKITDISCTEFSPTSPDSDRYVTFGLYAGGQCRRLRTDRRQLIASIEGDRAASWKQLDTALLQETILEPLLGIISDDRCLSFTQSIAGAQEAVDKGEATAAFFLESTDIDDIAAVAEAGEKMPQKSTYFWPKPRTGLVFNKFD